MSQTTPQVADTEATEIDPVAPRVRILLTAVAGADLDAALAVVRRQVYEPAPEVVIIGVDGDGRDDVTRADSLEEAISSTDSSFEYLWLLHADARPRPDALAALIGEIDRNEASLAGSKLLKAGTNDELESVGGATDVFGEPYSGLDEGEIDLQQYDVVREVAFVQSASMLVRRDLAQGLKGLDPLLPPVAAGLDFSQRTRLAGGRVISVPSSEVYHQARCGERGRGWREQAGRLRAMVTAYSPLTLMWVLPYDFLVSVADSIGNLLLLRWKPGVRHIYSWVWNTYHLPSTIRQRRRLRTIRSEGDEELFRFQARGSVRLREVGEEMSGRLLSMFDDDQTLARSTRRLWRSPGMWGAIVAAAVVLLAARSILFIGMPNTGFTFPFEPPSLALARWFGGWNDSGLGSGSAVHPSVGITGLVSLLWFGAEGAARVLLTLALALAGIAGLGRLAGRVGLRGPGRYLAGLVLISGPGTAVLMQRGSWLALGAAAALPWAVRSAFVRPGKTRFTGFGWALLTGAMVASFSPVLAMAPLVVVAVWRLLGGVRASFLLAATSAAGGVVALAFLLGDPGWLSDASRRLVADPGMIWPVLILAVAMPLMTAEGPSRSLALSGGALSLASLAALRGIPVGPGVEEALFVLSSLGAGLAVAAALDRFSRDVFRVVAAVSALAALLLSLTSIGGGRLGLPSGDVNERLAFAQTLADESGVGRILHVSTEGSLIPGEVRSGPGLWYRVLDGHGTTHDEIWLPAPEAGDRELALALTEIASGTELRPGDRLAQFAIDWVVLEGPTSRLDEVLVSQLDLVPLPLDPEARVFENENALPIAGPQGDPWVMSATGFSGDPIEGRVGLAVNYSPGWGPDGSRQDWTVTIDGSKGEARYVATDATFWLAAASSGLVAVALGLILIGRRKR